jgi:ribonuclease R
MAARMRINRDGILIDVKILRGLMKSAARLTYNMVQEALDGHPNDLTKPLLKTVIQPLYEAYKVLDKARHHRGAVDLDLPERKVILKNGKVEDISKRMRLDSHKLIEEFMILANVAVATAFGGKRPGTALPHPRQAGQCALGQHARFPDRAGAASKIRPVTDAQRYAGFAEIRGRP